LPQILRNADPIRQTIADQIAPVTRLDAELTRQWPLALDVARARARLEAGLVAFEPLEVIGAAGDLLVPFVRATVALERAGLATDSDAVQARERRYQILPLVVSWLGGEPLPRDRAKATARRAAALVGASVLRRASELLRSAESAEVRRDVERSLASWQRPVCPCCGSVPDFAVREGAERTLVCARCDSTWRTSAFGCLGCGAKDAPTIARITSPAIGYQLTICNSCGRYVKEPLETRAIEPLLERALTSELDAAAEARGLRL
jgi:hypothetical protein